MRSNRAGLKVVFAAKERKERKESEIVESDKLSQTKSRGCRICEQLCLVLLTRIHMSNESLRSLRSFAANLPCPKIELCPHFLAELYPCYAILCGNSTYPKNPSS